MLQLLAGAFASIGMLFGGLFGGHPVTPPNGNTGSSTPMHGMHTGSSTPGMWMGSTTPNGKAPTPTVVGVVASIDGTTLTVSGFSPSDMHMTPGQPMKMASTTYSVDASSAKISERGDATSTISSVKVGDHVVVVGTLSGTSVTATAVLDGVMPMQGRSPGMGHGSSTPPTGSGSQPQQGSQGGW